MRLAAALALLLAMPADAVPIVDQEALPTGGTFRTEGDTNTRQSVTFGLSGLLTQVDVYVTDDFNTCDSRGCAVWLFIGDEPTPVQGYLPPEFQDRPLANEWAPFLLLTPISVLEGQMIEFDVEHDNLISFAVGDYPGALQFRCESGVPCLDPLDPNAPSIPNGTRLELPLSYAFRTYVEVPEPSILALAAALLALGVAVHRSRV